jgi:hypothetical protein
MPQFSEHSTLHSTLCFLKSETANEACNMTGHEMQELMGSEASEEEAIVSYRTAQFGDSSW